MKTNTQTDTPETDAVEQHVQRDINRKWVLSDFCKRKERERDAALRKLEELRKAIQKRHDERQAQVLAFKERFPDYDATCDFATEYETLLTQPQ